jgi:hypothetical protein
VVQRNLVFAGHIAAYVPCVNQIADYDDLPVPEIPLIRELILFYTNYFCVPNQLLNPTPYHHTAFARLARTREVAKA